MWECRCTVFGNLKQTSDDVSIVPVIINFALCIVLHPAFWRIRRTGNLQLHVTGIAEVLKTHAYVIYTGLRSKRSKGSPREKDRSHSIDFLQLPNPILVMTIHSRILPSSHLAVPSPISIEVVAVQG